MLPLITYILVFITVFLATVVYYNNRKSWDVRLYLLLSLSSSVWMLSNGFVLSLDDPGQNLLASMSITPSSALSLYFFTLIAWRFVQGSRVWGIIVILLSSLLFVVLLFSFSEANVSQITDPDGRMEYQFGWLYYPYVVFLLCSLLSGLCMLFQSWKSSKGVKKQQISYILLGFGLMLVPAIVMGVILPILGNNSLWDYAHLSMVVLVVSIAYAVAKHRLYDVRLVAARAVTYFLVTAMIFGGYMLVANVLATEFVVSSAETTRAVLALVSIVTGLLLWPLVRYFNRLTDRIFYRDGYKTHIAVDQLQMFLMSVNDMAKMSEGLAHLFRGSVKPVKLTLIVYQEGGVGYSIYGEKLVDSQEIELLKAKVGIFNFLSDDSGVQDETLTRFMKRNNASVFVPLESSFGAEGLLLLYDKSNGGIYTKQDMDFLHLASINIGQTLQGVRSYQKISEFNKTLREKVKDATRELRMKNSELEALHKTKDDFISMASHQLRPKLTAASGFLDLLDATKLKTTKEQAELLYLTREGLQRMTDIVVDMLDVSRMDARQIQLDFGGSTTDIAELVRREVETAGSSADPGRFVLAPLAKGSKAETMVDEVKLREVISNLLSNANQYSPKGSEVRAEVRTTGGFIKVLVSDKGIGMTAQEKSKLFTKFYRSDEAKQLRPSGSGIGLYMSRKIVEAHGGEMIVQSKKGKGSTIGFKIPLKRSHSHG